MNPQSELDDLKRRISLFGAPCDLGASTRGANMGPAALRVARLAETLQELGYEAEDRGDVAPSSRNLFPISAQSNPQTDGNYSRAPEILNWVKAIEAEATKIFGNGELPVLMGGDHSLSIGTLAAAAKHARTLGRKLFVLWVDAHADFNTPQTSPSGNVHGMTLAVACGEPGLELFRDENFILIPPAQVFMIGIRQIDKGERRLLEERGVNVIDMPQIDETGVAAQMRQILETVRAENGLLHVSLDADFIDPSIAPGVGTPVQGGATYREAHLVMEMLEDSGLMTSLDLVEVNPFLDERGKTALLIVDLCASLFGRSILDRPIYTAGRK
jgi:arginase